MTLANFNSNFNFQLRALQQAAECCGIVPDLPPTPPLVFDCYFYTFITDPTCTAFNIVAVEWELNSIPFSFGWYNLMIASPYGTVGNGYQYTDPLNGCGAGVFNNSSYYMWTVVPSTTLTLPPLVGNDSNGNPVSYPMLGPICDRKCYEGSFRSGLGSTIIYGINTAEVNAGEYSFYVDLSLPSANLDFVNALGQFYPSTPIGVTITENAPGDYTIRIDGLYSLGTQVFLFMDDNITVGVLDEIPC